MSKKIWYLFLIPVILAVLNAPVLAQKPQEEVLPEKEGIYNVPGRPDLKLRVFVYHAKPDNPGGVEPALPNLNCSLSDPNSGAIVAGAGWKLPSSWTYRLNPTSVPVTVGSGNLMTISGNAFNEWLKALGNNKVSITKGSDTTVNKAQFDGQNIITWGRTSGAALAVSYIWYSGGIAREIDTIMNNKFTWYWSNPNDWNGKICAYSGVYDAQDILTHELGHTFGLDDHYTSAYVNNTMYGYGSKTEVKKDTLTTGDKIGVVNLY